MLLASSSTSLAATAIESHSTNINRDDLANSKRSRFGRLIDALAPADAFELEIAGRIVHNHIELDELTQSTSARLVAGDLARDSKELAALVKLEVHLERMLAASLRDLRTLRSLRGRAARGSTSDMHNEHSPLELSVKSSIEIDHPAKKTEVDADPIASPTADFASCASVEPAATDLPVSAQNSQIDNKSAYENQTTTESIVSRTVTPPDSFNLPGSLGAGPIESSRLRSDRSDRTTTERSTSRVSKAAESANRRQKKRDRRSKRASQSTFKPSVSDWFESRRVDSLRVDSLRDESFRGAPFGARPGSFLAANASIFAEPFERLDDAFCGFLAAGAS